MIIVADASVLVGELLRQRGRELLLDPQLRLVVAEDQWEETEHELSRRLEILQTRDILTDSQRELLSRSVRDLVDAPRDRAPRHLCVSEADGAPSSAARFKRLADGRAGDRPRRCDLDRRQRFSRLRLPYVDR